jgi:hypothetical protein
MPQSCPPFNDIFIKKNGKWRLMRQHLFPPVDLATATE